MRNISSAVEKALSKHAENSPELNYNISNNLEFRLLFPFGMSKPFKEAKKDFMKSYLNDLLTISLGNISMAAKKANLHRRHLHRIINELDIDPELHRRELIKPAEYMKENIYNILESLLSNLSTDTEKIKNIYTNLSDISEIIAKNIELAIPFDEALELFEREFIGNALKMHKYDIPKTASAIDLSERTIYRKISKLNIVLA